MGRFAFISFLFLSLFGAKIFAQRSNMLERIRTNIREVEFHAYDIVYRFEQNDCYLPTIRFCNPNPSQNTGAAPSTPSNSHLGQEGVPDCEPAPPAELCYAATERSIKRIHGMANVRCPRQRALLLRYRSDFQQFSMFHPEQLLQILDNCVQFKDLFKEETDEYSNREANLSLDISPGTENFSVEVGCNSLMDIGKCYEKAAPIMGFLRQANLSNILDDRNVDYVRIERTSHNRRMVMERMFDGDSTNPDNVKIVLRIYHHYDGDIGLFLGDFNRIFGGIF